MTDAPHAVAGGAIGRPRRRTARRPPQAPNGGWYRSCSRTSSARPPWPRTAIPEETRNLLTRYFETASEIIGRYGGTVEKFIGDAVMAVWGVPVAHEDDAERAVRAALDLIARR